MHQKQRPAGQGRGANGEPREHANVRAKVTRLQVADDVNDDVAIAVEGFRELVPDGRYEAKFIGHDTALLFKQPKVFLRFEIVQHGEYFEKQVRLARPYRVRRVIAPAGPSGRFILDGGSDCFRMLVRVLDVKQRKDRISLRGLKHLPLHIVTRTVIKDRNGRDLPELARYSVVEDITRAD